MKIIDDIDIQLDGFNERLIVIKDVFIAINTYWLFQNIHNSQYIVNPIQGEVCKFAHPYLDVIKRNIWGAAGALNFFTVNIIILDIFCENVAYAAPQPQILQSFSVEDHLMLQSEPYKMAKLVNVL